MTAPIIDRDAIIEKALIASGSEMTVGGIVRVAIKTAADDLLAPIEALHETRVVFDDAAMTTGRRECSCGIVVQAGDLDCPTAKAVAAIREAVRA